MSYYNTTGENNDQLDLFRNKAVKQDQAVLNIIRTMNKPFSASQVYKRYPIDNVPITSIRRSIHTLHNKHKLIKQTGQKVQGIYGRPELQYELVINEH